MRRWSNAEYYREPNTERRQLFHHDATRIGELAIDDFDSGEVCDELGHLFFGVESLLSSSRGASQGGGLGFPAGAELDVCGESPHPPFG